MEDPGDDEHQNIGRAAHETNNQYHDLMAKRARLMREVYIFISRCSHRNALTLTYRHERASCVRNYQVK